MAQSTPIQSHRPFQFTYPVTMVDRPSAMGLDDRERARLFGVMESLMSVHSVAAFKHWSATDLQTVLPHGMMACSLAEVRMRDARIHKILTRDWPLAYFDALRRADGTMQCPIMARWHADPSPQMYDPRFDSSIDNRQWLDAFQTFQLDNVLVHGLRDVGSSHGSCFKFARLGEGVSPRHAQVLDLLVPHMHVALVRVMADVPAMGEEGGLPRVRLTPREREVLSWMVEGKTNWEIAQIGGRSEHTVRHQVARLLVKLNASNRAQAVARAMSLRLVH